MGRLIFKDSETVLSFSFVLEVWHMRAHLLCLETMSEMIQNTVFLEEEALSFVLR